MRGGRVSLCVLDEQWPPTYRLVYCDAVVETDVERTVDVFMGVAGVMAGQPMPPQVWPMVEEGSGARTGSSSAGARMRPSRHPLTMHSADDIGETLAYGLGATLPWIK